MSTFADIRFLIKRLQVAIISNRDIWDSIVIIVAHDSLHNDFESTTTTILECGNKTINKIQQILASAEAKLISKQATGVIAELAMLSKGHIKRKAALDNKSFNCEKMGHFGKNCIAPMTCKKNKSNKT